jgi:hypothetical protein
MYDDDLRNTGKGKSRGVAKGSTVNVRSPNTATFNVFVVSLEVLPLSNRDVKIPAPTLTRTDRQWDRGGST